MKKIVNYSKELGFLSVIAIFGSIFIGITAVGMFFKKFKRVKV